MRPAVNVGSGNSAVDAALDVMPRADLCKLLGVHPSIRLDDAHLRTGAKTNVRIGRLAAATVLNAKGAQ